MTTLTSVFNDCAAGIRTKVTGIYGLLVAGAWRAKLSPVLQ
jgi:hypothetical protein